MGGAKKDLEIGREREKETDRNDGYERKEMEGDNEARSLRRLQQSIDMKGRKEKDEE